MARGAEAVVTHDDIPGEVKLVAALLADAVGLAAHAYLRRRLGLAPSTEQVEAWLWLFQPAPPGFASNATWTFEDVVSFLGREPDAMRRRLRAQIVLRSQAARPRPRAGYTCVSGGKHSMKSPTARHRFWAERRRARAARREQEATLQRVG